MNYIKSFLIILLTGSLLTSCLKSEDQFGWVEDKGTIVSGIFDKSYYGESKPYVLNLNPLIESFPDFLSLRYSAARSNQPGGNIHIKISTANSAALVAAYNTKKRAEAAAVGGTWTDLVPLPANAFTLNALEFDIPKEGGEVLVPMTLNKNNINLANQYALGVHVTEVSEGLINELEKQIVVTFQVKNKYDGVYKLTLRHDNWQAYGIASGVSGLYGSGTTPIEISVITTGANSVKLGYAGFGDIQPAFTGATSATSPNPITGTTGFGATTPRYTFDLTTDKAISVVNTTPDDGRGRTLFLAPGTTTSGYNPTTKTIYLEYFMTQTGRPDMPIWTTFEYIRSR